MFTTKPLLISSLLFSIIASGMQLEQPTQQPSPFAINQHADNENQPHREIINVPISAPHIEQSLEWIKNSEYSKKMVIIPARCYDVATESRAFHLKQMLDHALNPSYPQPFEPLKTLLGYIQSGHQFVYNVMNEIVECDCIRYDRQKFPEVRGTFEEKLLAEIPKSPLMHSNQMVTVSFIGSGFLYSALVKITKLLERHQNLRIILVDTLYHGFIDDQNQQSTECGFGHYSQRAAQRDQKHAQQALIELSKWLVFLHRYFYKEAHIEIITYKEMRDYATDCMICSNNKAQVLVIEDLDNPLQYEEVIKSAYTNILQPGGVYAILADHTRLCWEKPNPEREQELLHARIKLDDTFGYDLSQNSIRYIHYAQRIAQIRHYVGVKKS